MSISYLLDTSILILALKHDPIISERLVNIHDAAYVSVIAFGELYHGAEASTRVNQNKADIDDIAQGATILTVDQGTALVYGRIRYEQRLKGQLIPDNDLWIAATALKHGLTLVAQDEHFTWIDKLSLEQW